VPSSERVSAPEAPSRHGTAAPGKAAKVRATSTNHAHGRPATRATNCAAPIDTCARPAVTTPRIVAGATAGSASRFAGIDARLICPEIDAISGAHASVAAVGTASASASQHGSRVAIQVRSGGASNNKAPVATTESANPTLRASVGSM
jgi:hypothetical protein